MRRRPPPSPALLEGRPPPELRVGRCIEVWAAASRSWTDAWRRYSRARHNWEKEQGLSTAESCRLLRGPTSPWSIERLDAEGHGAEVDARLTRVGIRRDELAALRSAAQARVAGEPDFRLR